MGLVPHMEHFVSRYAGQHDHRGQRLALDLVPFYSIRYCTEPLRQSSTLFLLGLDPYVVKSPAFLWKPINLSHVFIRQYG